MYGKDEATRVQAEKREVTRRLASIYDQRHNMEPSAQELLFPYLHTHLEQPMWVIKNWITIKGPTFAQILRTVKARAILSVRSIRDYFAPQPSGCQTIREISGTVPERGPLRVTNCKLWTNQVSRTL